MQIQTKLKPTRRILLDTPSIVGNFVPESQASVYNNNPYRFIIAEAADLKTHKLVKSTNPKIQALGLFRLVGPLQEAEVRNRNRRVYPKKVLETAIEILKEDVDKGEVYGRLDHPTEEKDMFDKSLKTASHLITKVWMENNVVMGEMLVLPVSESKGPVLYEYIKYGYKVGFSARGMGSTEIQYNTLTESGEPVEVVLEDYRILTYDAVANPSHEISNTYNMQVLSEAVKRKEIINLISQKRLEEAQQIDARIFDELMDLSYRLEVAIRFALND